MFSRKNIFLTLFLLFYSAIGYSSALAEGFIQLPLPNIMESDSPQNYYNEAMKAEEKGSNLEASIALRRSLILDPTFLASRNQLTSVLKKMGLPPVDTTWQSRIAAHVSPERITVIGSVLGWSATLFIVGLFFTRYTSTRKRKFLWGFAIIAFFLGHGMALLGFLIDPRVHASHQVVLHPRMEATSNTANNPTPLRSTPVDNGDIIVQLPSGVVLTLLSRHGVWSYVRTNTGQQGWIPSLTMESLIPHKAMP